MADKKTGIAIAAAAAAAAIIPGLPRDIDVTRYTVCSSKIHTPVRMMILSDLHNADYGMNMEDLMVKVLAEKPDLILMPGDMAEEHMHQDNTLVLMKALRDFPVYYSTGNHEEYRPDLEDLLKKFREAGVQVLSYRNAVFTKGDTSLEIVGIPCRKHESDYSADDSRISLISTITSTVRWLFRAMPMGDSGGFLGPISASRLRSRVFCRSIFPVCIRWITVFW